MDLNEKVAYEKTISAYIENNKLADIVESLTSQLVLHQPADPIQFLIDHISSKRAQRLIFVTGSHAGQRKEIVDQISRTFNYAAIDVEAEEGGVVAFKDRKSEITNQHVKERVSKVEKHYRGVVLSGYPFDFETAIFAQQNGLLPDRIFILSSSKADLLTYYESIYAGQEGLAERAVLRDKLNKKELKQMYHGFFDYFNVSKMHKLELAENVKNILKIKDKIIVPLRSPRVIVIRPPHLRSRAQQVVKSVTQRYGFNSISTYTLLDKHIQDKTEIGKFIYQAMQSKSTIPDEIIVGLIRSQMLNTSSKKRGYVLEGFPRTLKQVDAIVNYAMNPHLIIVIDQDEESLSKQLKQLKVDSLTGRHYENLDENIANRLVMNTMTESDIEAKIATFKSIVEAVEARFGSIVQKFKLNTDTNEKIVKTIDVVLNNPAIYS